LLTPGAKRIGRSRSKKNRIFEAETVCIFMSDNIAIFRPFEERNSIEGYKWIRK